MIPISLGGPPAIEISITPVSRPASASAASCERNRDFILSILQNHLNTRFSVFEVGSGTGDHACYFAPKFPHLVWQTSEKEEYLKSLDQKVESAKIYNVLAPVEFDVSRSAFPKKYEAILTSNTLHCMSEDNAASLIQKASKALEHKGLFMVYGPMTSFIKEQASVVGLQLLEEHYNDQSNNYMLVFQKIERFPYPFYLSRNQGRTLIAPLLYNCDMAIKPCWESVTGVLERCLHPKRSD